MDSAVRAPVHVSTVVNEVVKRLIKARTRRKEMRCLKVYTIVDRGERKKAIWLQIGAAFENKDGSLNVRLNALPTDGKLHIRNDDPAE